MVFGKISKNIPEKNSRYTELRHEYFNENRPYHFKFFKDCLPQTLLGSFLITLTHLTQFENQLFP